jgi:hypothetical protein
VKRMTPAQILLGKHIKELLKTQGDWELMREVEFCEGRKWAFDLAIPAYSIAFECNGGMRSGGHRRGAAIEDENDKINTATAMGWKVFQWTNEQINDGRAKQFLAEWLGKENK